MNVKGEKKEDQGFRKKLWDAKNKNFIWQFKKMKFSQQHTEVRAERQIEKSLKEFCTSKLPLNCWAGERFWSQQHTVHFYIYTITKEKCGLVSYLDNNHQALVHLLAGDSFCLRLLLCRFKWSSQPAVIYFTHWRPCFLWNS